ncbi:ECs1072 family phage-associated protein [Yokenella regensburgei]|uniref:ECs1072 family phage-associated protein n=1 Tax=Yokenella regensburgei TaxID=158877 RepID=UPI003B52DD84
MWVTQGEGIPDWRAWLRAEQLLRLDLLIMAYNSSQSGDLTPLAGHNAISHILRLQTGLEAAHAASLSFADILHILQPALAAVNIPPEVQVYPEHVARSLTNAYEEHRVSLPPCSEDEWDPSLSVTLQEMCKP